MGFGFKYHVVTVAAIFLALTVGLVVGSLLLSPKVADQQASQIKRLQQVVTADFAANKTQKDLADKALAVFVPAAVKGKLTGTPIAVVLTGSNPGAEADAKDALLDAGAQVVSMTTIDHEMDRPDELLDHDLTDINNHDGAGRFPTDRAALAQQIASIIAKGDTPGGSLTPLLESHGYMHSDSDSGYRAGASCIVIVAGSQTEGSDRVANVDQPLIASFLKLTGVQVLMCEPSDARVSDVDSYLQNKIGVTTIDDIDDPIGRGSLVFAIGGVVGDYGTKSTASAIYPPELQRYLGR